MGIPITTTPEVTTTEVPITITTLFPPDGQRYSSYSYQLLATGGTCNPTGPATNDVHANPTPAPTPTEAPLTYNWTITSGSLPNGLQLSSNLSTTSGQIYGTPTESGTFTIYVKACCRSNPTECSTPQVMQITIIQPPV